MIHCCLFFFLRQQHACIIEMFSVWSVFLVKCFKSKDWRFQSDYKHATLLTTSHSSFASPPGLEATSRSVFIHPLVARESIAVISWSISPCSLPISQPQFVSQPHPQGEHWPGWGVISTLPSWVPNLDQWWLWKSIPGVATRSITVWPPRKLLVFRITTEYTNTVSSKTHITSSHSIYHSFITDFFSHKGTGVCSHQHTVFLISLMRPCLQC